MEYLLRNANVYIDGGSRKTDIYIKDGMIVSFDSGFHSNEGVVSFDFDNKYIFIKAGVSHTRYQYHSKKSGNCTQQFFYSHFFVKDKRCDNHKKYRSKIIAKSCLCNSCMLVRFEKQHPVDAYCSA